MSRAAPYVTLKSQIASHKCLEILSTTPTDGFKVLCSLCGKSFDVKKTNHVSDHIRGTGHSRALSLQQKRQTTLQLRGSGIQGKPFFALYFYIIIYNNIIKYAFFSRRSVQPRSCKYLDRRRLPLHALDNEGLKNFMEKNMRRTIPTSKTLQTSYIKNN